MWLVWEWDSIIMVKDVHFETIPSHISLYSKPAVQLKSSYCLVVLDCFIKLLPSIGPFDPIPPYWAFYLSSVYFDPLHLDILLSILLSILLPIHGLDLCR